MKNWEQQLNTLKNRLSKLGIEIEYVANFPWIYLNKINGQVVTEKYEGNHGFTVAFLPVRADKDFHFTDLGAVFTLIRKYTSPRKQKE